MDAALAVVILLWQGQIIHEVGIAGGWPDALLMLVIFVVLDAAAVYSWFGNWEP